MCFPRTKLLRANVHFLSQPVVGGTTGTVIVLTTPDAQRTMLSYQVGIISVFSCRDLRVRRVVLFLCVPNMYFSCDVSDKFLESNLDVFL